MRIERLRIPGAALIWPELQQDHRGAFARTFCRDEFVAGDLVADVVQSSISFNERRGTLRGMHFQWPPSVEAKTVRCTAGRIFDVLLDLRPESPSYLSHLAVELDSRDRLAIHIPPGVAHGFQTLEDRTEVLYLMSDRYAPELAATVRWNDAQFAIEWPVADVILSTRDADCPPFDRTAFESALRERRAGA